MKKILLLIFFSSIFLSGQNYYDSGYIEPTDIAFSENEELIVLEKSGILFLEGTVIKEFENVNTDWNESGALTVFPYGSKYWVYHTHSDLTGVVKMFDASTNETTTIRVIDDFPGTNHHGGTLAKYETQEVNSQGENWFLMLSLGDRGSTSQAQNETTLLGKFILIDPYTGADYPGGVIFAMGLRNPVKFFIAEDGTIFCADVGSQQAEELNIIEQGKNYGWPQYEGFQYFSGGFDVEDPTFPILEVQHDVPNVNNGTQTFDVDLIGKALITGAKVGDFVLIKDFYSNGLWKVKVINETVVDVFKEEGFDAGVGVIDIIRKDEDVFFTNYLTGEIFFSKEKTLSIDRPAYQLPEDYEVITYFDLSGKDLRTNNLDWFPVGIYIEHRRYSDGKLWNEKILKK